MCINSGIPKIVYMLLYSLCCASQNSPRDLGDTQSWGVKIIQGGAFLAAFVLLIWGPLLVFSIISAASEPNPPVTVTIQLSIDSYEVCS